VDHVGVYDQVTVDAFDDELDRGPRPSSATSSA
jgi:hypothetical protein